MAQGYGRGGGFASVRQAREELQVLHRVYSHEINSGHPEAAMRAHMRAQAIRRRLRMHRDEDMGRNRW